jgi:hypothetical protein
MEFLTLILLELAAALPIIFYYTYWGIMQPGKRGRKRKDLLAKIKNAYIMTGVAILYMPLVLLYFLYENLLYLHHDIFVQTGIVIGVIIAIFEVVNYYSYFNYEMVRLKH